MQENYCNSPLFTYRCTSQGVKHSLFLRKYRLKVVKLKDCKTKSGGSKTFQKRYLKNREFLKNPNLVNTKVAKIIKYQPHGE